MEHQKHGCVSAIHAAAAPASTWTALPSGGTSELTVYLHVHRLTSGLKRGTARIMAVTGQEADECVGDERATDGILRLSGRTKQDTPVVSETPPRDSYVLRAGGAAGARRPPADRRTTWLHNMASSL